MTGTLTQKERVLELAKERGILSRADLREAGLPEEYLSRLEGEGELTILAPGIYMASDHEMTESFDLAVVAKKVPNAVVACISALQFHGLTTQVAHTVQVAIERGKWVAKLDWPQIEVFSISGDACCAGVETHLVEGVVQVQVYSVAKTIADLFKFRNTFGLDVAIEALKEGWRAERFTMDEVYAYAKICRVQKVMRPYLEMLS